ncbi:Tn7 transposase TnsA N-terminal domain-containing protein [Methylobacterium radiotolerans]|uniref:Tn7 transposase TnsA N-terminal domain-containing protein n=1 Tax=Methylobacterium radiotolerans TaxID=31998 RepID=UPI001F286363|nr:Tn7 transposase TnsA N-terminal domain-containing protein [Methylobacterium radiotolerans]UIY43420.1 Tn7 transposase TnsA N-terminal domain-containing protein [Methylobacterium radiotolerans]
MSTASASTEMAIRFRSSIVPENLGLAPGAAVVRKVKKRNYMCAVDGDGSDHKSLGPAPFRSLLERDLRTLLGANPTIVDYAIEPHELKYFIANKRGGYDPHVYVPDVVCRCRQGRIVVIDAKISFIASRPEWKNREPFIREAYWLDHGVRFTTIQELDIRAQPRLANCQILERHRYIVPDYAALLRIRDVLAEIGLPATIEAAVRSARLNSRDGECRAFTAIMNLALAGELILDLATPFSCLTMIYQATIR